MACFLYFSYFNAGLEAIDCYVAYGNNAPLNSTMIDSNEINDQTINVSHRFRMAIRFGFYITVLNFLRALIN
jgi:hypothetical protein